MEIEEKQLIQFHALLDRFFEKEATQEEVLKIQQLIQEMPGLKEYYFRYVELKAGLYQLKVHDEVYSSSVQQYDEAFLELSEYEKNAPAIDLDTKAPEREIIQKVVYEKQPRKISKFTIFSGFFSAAAMLLIVLFIRFMPERYSVEVATLVDQINIKWADSKVSFKNGDRLWTNQEPIGLEKGIVKIQYDDGVDVLIEGPAKFAIERSGVYIEYGRLFSRVSELGLGFLVETPTSRFVDMGTEFGVQADVNGSSELHVIKGKVQLFAGAKEKAKSSHVVTENQAMRYNANSSLVKEIPVQKQSFVRAIDSRTNTVWRGQMQINLADIVGGGNGFGTGKLDSGIETNTGRCFASPDPELVLSKVSGILTGGGAYNKVSDLALVDGVFVPDSRQGPVQITSAGHTFDGFAYGREVFWGNIFNGAWHASDTSFKHNLKLNGQTYGTVDNPAISLHSSQGITFDLRAIRQTIPSGRILRFTSLFGVSETVALDPSFAPKTAGSNSGKVNCWVLIDGKERLNLTSVSYLQGAVEINIDIHDEDRFLTLVVTESDDRRAYDWALFAKPFLQIEMDMD